MENIIDKGSASVFHLMASAVIDELWIHWFLRMAKWQSPIFLSLLHLLADTLSGIFIYCLVVLKHGPCRTNRINTRVLPCIDFLTNDLTLATHRMTNEIFFSLQYCQVRIYFNIFCVLQYIVLLFSFLPFLMACGTLVPCQGIEHPFPALQ